MEDEENSPNSSSDPDFIPEQMKKERRKKRRRKSTSTKQKDKKGGTNDQIEKKPKETKESEPIILDVSSEDSDSSDDSQDDSTPFRVVNQTIDGNGSPLLQDEEIASIEVDSLLMEQPFSSPNILTSPKTSVTISDDMLLESSIPPNLSADDNVELVKSPSIPSNSPTANSGTISDDMLIESFIPTPSNIDNVDSVISSSVPSESSIVDSGTIADELVIESSIPSSSITNDIATELVTTSSTPSKLDEDSIIESNKEEEKEIDNGEMVVDSETQQKDDTISNNDVDEPETNLKSSVNEEIEEVDTEKKQDELEGSEDSNQTQEGIEDKKSNNEEDIDMKESNDDSSKEKDDSEEGEPIDVSEDADLAALLAECRQSTNKPPNSTPEETKKKPLKKRKNRKQRKQANRQKKSTFNSLLEQLNNSTPENNTISTPSKSTKSSIPSITKSEDMEIDEDSPIVKIPSPVAVSMQNNVPSTNISQVTPIEQQIPIERSINYEQPNKSVYIPEQSSYGFEQRQNNRIRYPPQVPYPPHPQDMGYGRYPIPQQPYFEPGSEESYYYPHPPPPFFPPQYNSYPNRFGSYRPASDPTLVINMGELSESDSEMDNSSIILPKQSNSNVSQLPHNLKKDLQQKQEEILKLQEWINQAEQKRQPTFLEKRKQRPEEQTKALVEPSTKLFKIDIDVTRIDVLIKRIKERENTVAKERTELAQYHRESEQLKESITDLETKSCTMNSRILILKEKLRIFEEQQKECDKQKREAKKKLEKLNATISEKEEKFQSERSFLEQERVMLCELEIEKKFSTPSSSPNRPNQTLTQSTNGNTSTSISNKSETRKKVIITENPKSKKVDSLKKKEDVTQINSLILDSVPSPPKKDIIESPKELKESQNTTKEQISQVKSTNTIDNSINQVVNENRNIVSSQPKKAPPTHAPVALQRSGHLQRTQISSSHSVPTIISLPGESKSEKISNTSNATANAIRKQELVQKNNQLLEQIAEKQNSIRKKLEEVRGKKSLSTEKTTPKLPPKIEYDYHKYLKDFTYEYFISPQEYQYIDTTNSVFHNLSNLPNYFDVKFDDNMMDISDNDIKEQDRKYLSFSEEYNSPLVIFRSYRFSPHFQSQGKSITGPELLYDIDPSNILCRFEMHGTCNDDECPWTHFKDCTRSAKDIVELCANYARLRTKNKQLTPKIDSLLEIIRQQIGKAPTEKLICTFIQAINKISNDCHYLPLISIPSNHNSKSERISNKTPISSISLLGIGKTNTRKGKSKSEPTRVSVIEYTEPFENMLQHDIIPLYDQPLDKKGETQIQNEKFDSRYYSLTKDNYEKFLESDMHNISLWLHYALSKVTKPSDSNGKQKYGYYESMRILVRALENNPSSAETWRLYLDYFARCGSTENLSSVLQKASSYVPYSYSIWHLRWTLMGTLQQKLEILHSAIQQFLSYNCSSQTVSKEIISQSLLSFILSSLYLLFTAGHIDFAIKRILRLFPNHKDSSVVHYPFTAANQFLPENQILSLKEKLLPGDYCILLIHVSYVMIFKELSFDLQSLSRKIEPITISWEKANISKSKNTFSVINSLFESILGNTTIIHENTLPVVINYINLCKTFNSIEAARLACKKLIQLATDDTLKVQLLQIYAKLESSEDKAVGLLIYQKSLKQFVNSQSLLYSYASLLVKEGNTNDAIQILSRGITGKTGLSQEKTIENFNDSISQTNNDNVFLWLNFCLFLSLIKQSPKNAFEKALLFNIKRENRKLLFLE